MACKSNCGSSCVTVSWHRNLLFGRIQGEVERTIPALCLKHNNNKLHPTNSNIPCAPVSTISILQTKQDKCLWDKQATAVLLRRTSLSKSNDLGIHRGPLFHPFFGALVLKKFRVAGRDEDTSIVVHCHCEGSCCDKRKLLCLFIHWWTAVLEILFSFRGLHTL